MVLKQYKIIVGVPEEAANKVRLAMAEAGAGLSDKYSHASFSSKGIGRFKPLKGANPAIGKIGDIEEVIEEKIESICNDKNVKQVVEAIKKAHPYEEPVIDVIALEDLPI